MYFFGPLVQRGLPAKPAGGLFADAHRRHRCAWPHGSFSPGGENVPKGQTSAAALHTQHTRQGVPRSLATLACGSHSCQAPASQPRHVAPQLAHPGGGSVGAARQGNVATVRTVCKRVPLLRERPCRGRPRRAGRAWGARSKQKWLHVSVQPLCDAPCRSRGSQPVEHGQCTGCVIPQYAAPLVTV